jgi:hypothetical protein
LASGGVAGCVGGGRGRAMALDTASGGWGKGVRREFRVRSDPPYLNHYAPQRLSIPPIIILNLLIFVIYRMKYT